MKQELKNINNLKGRESPLQKLKRTDATIGYP